MGNFKIKIFLQTFVSIEKTVCKVNFIHCKRASFKENSVRHSIAINLNEYNTGKYPEVSTEFIFIFNLKTVYNSLPQGSVIGQVFHATETYLSFHF